MHIEILQSPWLCELMAFHINLRRSNIMSRKRPALFEGCSLTMNDEKPTLTCELFDSVKVDIDLTCSICLVSIQGFICFKNVLHIMHSLLHIFVDLTCSICLVSMKVAFLVWLPLLQSL